MSYFNFTDYRISDQKLEVTSDSRKYETVQPDVLKTGSFLEALNARQGQ